MGSNEVVLAIVGVLAACSSSVGEPALGPPTTDAAAEDAGRDAAILVRNDAGATDAGNRPDASSRPDEDGGGLPDAMTADAGLHACEPESEAPRPAGRTISVANTAELRRAVAMARAGDTIALAAGDYGELEIDGLRPATTVLLRGPATGTANLEQLSIRDSANLAFEKLTVEGGGVRRGERFGFFDVVFASTWLAAGRRVGADDVEFLTDLRFVRCRFALNARASDTRSYFSAYTKSVSFEDSTFDCTGGASDYCVYIGIPTEDLVFRRNTVLGVSEVAALELRGVTRARVEGNRIDGRGLRDRARRASGERNPSLAGVRITHGGEEVELVNNIVTGFGTGILDLTRGVERWAHNTAVGSELDARVGPMTLVENGVFGSIEVLDGARVEYCLSGSSVAGPGNMEGSPVFEAESRILAESSPGRNSGQPSDVARDFRGFYRDASPDMGAFDADGVPCL